MRQWHLNRIRKVIENDCQIAGSYSTAKGETCAVGALIKDVGGELPTGVTMVNRLSIRQIMTDNSLSTYLQKKISALGLKKSLERVMRRYALTVRDLEEIQQLNDTERTRQRRRQRIMDYLETICDSQTDKKDN